MNLEIQGPGVYREKNRKYFFLTDFIPEKTQTAQSGDQHWDEDSLLWMRGNQRPVPLEKLLQTSDHPMLT